jgi:hypothetical protein
VLFILRYSLESRGQEDLPPRGGPAGLRAAVDPASAVLDRQSCRRAVGRTGDRRAEAVEVAIADQVTVNPGVSATASRPRVWTWARVACYVLCISATPITGILMRTHFSFTFGDSAARKEVEMSGRGLKLMLVNETPIPAGWRSEHAFEELVNDNPFPGVFEFRRDERAVVAPNEAPRARSLFDWTLPPHTVRSTRQIFVSPLLLLAGVGIVSTAGTAAAVRRIVQSRRTPCRRRRGLCVSCGYDLRGSAGRCPECGTSSCGAEQTNSKSTATPF